MTPTELKQKRERLGLTQEQLGQKLGYSKRAVSSWEQGWRKVTPRVEKAIEMLERESK